MNNENQITRVVTRDSPLDTKTSAGATHNVLLIVVVHRQPTRYFEVELETPVQLTLVGTTLEWFCGWMLRCVRRA